MTDPVADRAADLFVKQERIASLLREIRRDGLLVLDPANFAWLTAGAVAKGVVNPAERPVLFFQGPQRWVVCCNADTQRLFDEELDGLGFQLKEWPWQWGRAQLLADLCHGKRIACDVPFSDCQNVGERLTPHPMDSDRVGTGPAEGTRQGGGPRGRGDVPKCRARRARGRTGGPARPPAGPPWDDGPGAARDGRRPPGPLSPRRCNCRSSQAPLRHSDDGGKVGVARDRQSVGLVWPDRRRGSRRPRGRMSPHRSPGGQQHRTDESVRDPGCRRAHSADGRSGTRVAGNSDRLADGVRCR